MHVRRRAQNRPRRKAVIRPRQIALGAWLRHRWQTLKLASKLNLTLVSVGLAGLVLAGLALDWTIRPAFEGLERRGVEQQAAQAQALIRASLTSIENATKDYAVWDGSYDYVATGDSAFEAETLTTLALVNAGVNAIAYVRFNGEVLHSAYVNLESQTDEPDRNVAFARAVASGHVLSQARDRTSFVEFIELDGRVLAVAVAQVVRSDATGVPLGYIVMATEFTGASASAALQIASSVSTDIAPASVISTRDVWQVVVPIAAPNGASVGSLAFEAPRDTSTLGANTIFYALLSSTLVIASMLFVVFVVTRFLVVSRLAGIDAHMRQIARDGVLSPLRSDPSRDEIGALGHSFNLMLADLKDLREQLDVQSFELGKSESAAGAMHNVRNSLNLVTVILSQAISEHTTVSAHHVTQAIGELSTDDTARERRDRLATFLSAAFEDFERRGTVRRESFLIAKTSLAEALEILRLQGDDIQQEIPLEQFDVLDVVKRCALLARFTAWREVTIDIPEHGMMVRANQLLTSQVIGNLLTNAIEAIAAADRRPGCLRVSFARIDERGAAASRITIDDNGAGFEPAIAARLFERGYSSKRARTGGLGLHWCANTIRAMGGTLSLESDGPGSGARASVVLQGPTNLATARDATSAV